MNILLAPDKFKHSFTGFEFCEAVTKGLTMASSNIDVISCPLADGGDGTTEIIAHYLEAETITITVNDPWLRPVHASYLYSRQSQTAYIEMASASGLRLLTEEERNCLYTSTWGTGELILDAFSNGAKEVILGIGGSATNDGGMGMAAALGYRFFDIKEEELPPIGKSLVSVAQIKDSEVPARLKDVKFKIACDVTNPFYGKNGAAHIYAPQKGANTADVLMLDNGLKNFARVLELFFNKKVQDIPGAGAAGGLGGGAVCFLNAKLVSGIQLLMELTHFENKLQKADWVITGEGLLDAQTLSGKTIQGVIKKAGKHNVPVAAFCGAVALSPQEQDTLGLTYVASILKNISTLDKALLEAYENLIFTAYNFGKAIIDQSKMPIKN